MSDSSSFLDSHVPEALAPLLQPKRYKGAYGGRGGAKSHFFAEQVILRCYAKKTRVVCIREVQNSIKESVRQLIVDKIASLGIGEHFDILESEIRGTNGSLIIFKGMQSYNAQNIKSLEDYDIAWVEEAQTFSDISLRILRPTLRKPGSEIWFSWNPRYETDAVDKFFRGGEPREDAIIVPVGWQDNPWLPDVLRHEMETDYAADPEMAGHVWGGSYETVSEAAYYAPLIAAAENEGRIGHYPYDPQRPVETAWDIGIDDYTAIWFVQRSGVTATVIDYYETSGLGAEQIVKEALPELNPEEGEKARYLIEAKREQPFRYGDHFLPHDVKVREWGAGGKTRMLTLMGFGVKPIRAGVAQGPEERINATRALLPNARFNRTTRVMLGVSRLRRYSRRFNESMQTFGGPLHDINSHGADAFGEFAVNCGLRAPAQKPKQDKDRWDKAFDKAERQGQEATSWKTS